VPRHLRNASSTEAVRIVPADFSGRPARRGELDLEGSLPSGGPQSSVPAMRPPFIISAEEVPTSDPLLAEQIAHYRAIANEYEDLAISERGADELSAVLEAFRPAGHVLELACGPGAWTERLLRHATTVTAVDAAPEMLARAKARVGDERVRFIHADLFAWLCGRQLPNS
jgi:hypothetical protein